MNFNIDILFTKSNLIKVKPQKKNYKFKYLAKKDFFFHFSDKEK